MGSKILRIAKWKETFEKSDAKKLVSLPWISVPTNLDSNGFVTMVEEFGPDEAPALYGAWIALCAYAAGCNERGTLATNKGAAIPLSRVSRKTGFREELFEKLVTWAVSESIGWIEIVESPAALPAISVQPPCVVGKSPDYGQDGQDKTRQDGRTDGAREDRPDSVRPIFVKGCWEEIKPKAQELHKAIDPALNTLSTLDKRLCVDFAAIHVGYPGLREPLDLAIEKLRERNRRNKLPERPWGWIKAELIRICNEKGPGYDAIVGAIEHKQPTAAKQGT